MKAATKHYPLVIKLVIGDRLLNAWLRLPPTRDRQSSLRDIARFWAEIQNVFHYANRAVRQRYQERKLRNLLSLARSTLAYQISWGEDILGKILQIGLKNLDYLPITSKEHLASFWPHGTKPTLLSWDRILQEEATAGVTSPPLQFFSDRKFFPRLISSFSQAFLLSGGNPEKDITTVSTPYRYINILTPQQKVRAIDFRRLLSEEKYHEISQFLRMFDSDMLLGYPSDLLQLTSMMRALEIPAPRSRRFSAVLAYGEPLSTGQRQFIQEFFDVPVFSFYELIECGIVGIECQEHIGYHVDESSHIIEVVDAEGRPVPAGITGKILITSFLNEIMPFVRYDTGDLGFFHSGQCRCGRDTPLLVIIGREHDRPIFPLRDRLETIGFMPGAYQIVAIAKKPLELRIFPQRYLSATEKEERIRNLQQLIEQFPELRINADQDPTYVLRGKIPFVISRPNMTIHLW